MTAAERSLRESEEKFALAFRRAPTMMALTEVESGQYLDVNEAYVRGSGFTLDELLGRTTVEVGWVGPEDRERLRTLILEQGQATDLEMTLHPKDGAPITCLCSSVLVTVGGRKRLLTTLQDITPLLRTQAALKEAEGRYRAVFEDSPLGLWLEDLSGLKTALARLKAEGVTDFRDHFTRHPGAAAELAGTMRILEINAAGLRMMGILGREPADPHPLSTGFTPQAMEAFAEELASMAEGKLVHRSEFSLLGLDGGTRWFDLSVAVQQGHEEDFSQVLVMMHETTERKRAEAARDASVAAFQEAMEYLPVPLGITAGDTIVRFNQKFVETYGWTPADTPDMDAWLLAAYPDPAYRAASLATWIEDVGRAMERRESTPAREYRLACKDGSRKDVIITGRQIGTQFVASFVDITERRLAEERQAELQAQLQHSQKMESVGSLAGGIAHDMNNVLGAVLALSSANADLHPAGSPARRAFETISQAAVRGGEMVGRLLAFARKSPAKEHEVDLNKLLCEVVQLLERTTLAKVRLHLDLAPGLASIRGDGSALTHAFMNLCVNAVDAMPGNGTLTIRTRELEGARVEVVVEDTGCGMPKEVLERAMDPFFTTKPEGQGTGLGLPLVYSTVTSHRGAMEIQSEPGKGTRISLSFPASQTGPQLSLPPGAAPSAARERTLDVLLVDDDELMRLSIEMLLETMGHTCTPVTSGEEALASLEGGFRPDVVILDVNMPGLGGAATLPALRALCPGLPVVLATGRADQSALDLAGAYRGVALLAKPFTLEQLQAQLKGI